MSWPVDGVYASLNEVRVEFLCGGRAPKGNRMVGIGNEGWKRIQQLILLRGTILNQISTVDRRGLTFSSNRFVSPVCPAYCFNISNQYFTCCEENDGFQTGIFGRVDVQRFELLHLFLEDADVIHKGHDTVGGHRAGVKSGGGQQRSHVQRHRTLRRVQDKQFAPH